MGSEETYEGKVGGRIKAVDDRARQKFKGRVRALRVISPLSLNLLTKFAAIFVDFSEEVVEDFGVYGDDNLRSWRYISYVFPIGVLILFWERRTRLKWVHR